jgi:hypothetical protein
MSLRITAQMICISHFPRALSPLAHYLMTGLHLSAVMAGKYSAQRMCGVPIFDNRARPRTDLPDSRSRGTSPANAATSLALS